MILPWTGGKSRLAEQIIGTFPKHSVYIEPFFGAGWVFFKKQPADTNIINDINDSLINFYQVIRDEPQTFLKELFFTLRHETQFEEFKQIYFDKEQYNKLNKVRKALIYYYLVKGSYNGLIRSFSLADKGMQSDGVLETMWSVSKMLRDTIILNRDYREILKHYVNPKTLVYLDPPYAVTIKDGKSYYEYYMSEDQHEELKHILLNLDCKWVLSYDIHPLVDKLYKDVDGVFMQKTKMVFQSSINKHKRFVGEDTYKDLFKQEYLITNFKIQESLPLFQEDK